jgi:hypothetical protein
MLKTVLLLLLAYIAYKFIFGFVIPVSRATRNVRRQFKAAQEEMAARMQEQQGFDPYGANPQGATAANARTEPSKPTSKGDYIEFEEIK